MCRKECVDLQVNELYCGTCDNSCDNNSQVNNAFQDRSLTHANYRENCKGADTALPVSLPKSPTQYGACPVSMWSCRLSPS